MKKIIIAVIGLTFMSTVAFGAPPLTVNDTGTAGKGKTELEIRGSYGYTKFDKVNNSSVGGEVRFGILENLNVEVAYDRSFGDVFNKDFSGTNTAQVRLKYRANLTKNLSLSLAPRYTYNYTVDTRGGSSSYGANAAVQYDLPFASVFANVGYDYTDFYLKNEYNALRNNLFTYGIGTIIPIGTTGVKVVGEYYSSSSYVKGDSTYPGYAGGGLQYGYKMIDVGVGAVAGINQSSQDYIIKSGLIVKF